METQFARITAVARQKPEEKFTSLVHLINEQSLAESHAKLRTGKASGIDEVTKEEYVNVYDIKPELLGYLK